MEGPRFDELPNFHVLAPEDTAEDIKYVNQEALANFVADRVGAQHVAHYKKIPPSVPPPHLRRRVFTKDRSK